jgi:hypothetical protein
MPAPPAHPRIYTAIPVTLDRGRRPFSVVPIGVTSMYENTLGAHHNTRANSRASGAATDRTDRVPASPTPGEVFFDLGVLLAACLSFAATVNILVLALAD